MPSSQVGTDRHPKIRRHNTHLYIVLLRMFESYSGLLILTTNRIGTFDDAFISRIHLVLHYPELQDKGREDIWRSCFNSLELERGDKITIFQSARDYAIRSEEVKELNLNGREINNGIYSFPSPLFRFCSRPPTLRWSIIIICCSSCLKYKVPSFISRRHSSAQS